MTRTPMGASVVVVMGFPSEMMQNRYEETGLWHRRGNDADEYGFTCESLMHLGPKQKGGRAN